MSTGAAEMVAYCGMEEHTHSEACYCAVQAEGEAAAETLAAAVPTGETAAETTEETTAPTEGAALSVSGGSDAQALIGEYVEKELCCGMEEHKHAIACYSNPLADLETAAIWEATLPEKLSGDWGKDLAEVAKSQLGYAESAANYLVGADGETLMGYSRYGAWYSSYTQDEKQAYADWNVPFLFFCLYYAGVEDFPIEEDCADWTAALAAAELWRDVAGEYIPEAGDLVFLDTDEDGAADRAAVVTDWDEAKVTAVESDSEGAVKTVTYDLTEDTQVLGYGATNEAQAQIEVSGGEDAPVLMASLDAGYDYFYIDISNVTWSPNDGAEIRLWYWNNGGSGKYSDRFIQDSGNIYKLLVPSDMNVDGAAFVLVRMASGKVTTGSGSWQDPINRVKDNITVEKGKNLYTLGTQVSQGSVDINNGSWSNTWYGSDLSSGGGGGRSYSGSLKVGDTIYLDIGTWSGNSSGKFRVEIDGAKYELTHVSGNIYSIKIPNEASLSKSWKFRRDDPNNWDTNWNSVSTDLPTDGKNCFKVTKWDNQGTWSTYGGGTVTGTVVDIKSEAFSPADDTYYVNASFYDYYSDYEVDGYNRDNNPTGFVKGDHWLTFKKFNGALSSYYRNNNVKIPLYVGHFQPDWKTDGQKWGWKYQDMKGSESLYGFKQSGVYGANDSDQKWFMSVNNSNMNLDPSIGHVYKAAQGLVSDTLDNGNLRSVKTDDQTMVAMPLFDEAFLLNTKSNNNAIADVYHNVSFPFTKEDIDDNGVEYWVFDSEDTTLEMKQDSATGDYFLENVGYQSWSKNLNADGGQTGAYGFFPFNSGANSGNANTYNYGFGCRLDIPFRLTEDGTVPSNNGSVPIKFEFSGDDDVWVFIDGKLVLDIGGSHGKVTGTINFAGEDGDTRHMDVSATKSNPGNKTNTEKTTFTLSGKNTDDHVLTMFYMERGMWESNMRVTFNFPDENQLEVEKEVDMGNVNDIFKDSFKNQKLFTFNIKNLATHFADVNAKGATYNAIPWDVAGSTLTKDPSNTFSRDTYHDRSNALRWFAQYDDGSSQYRHKRYGVLSLPDTIDITNMAKLSFDVFVEGVSSFSLSNMYLQILDADVAISDLVDSALTAGNNNAMGCISSSLSGKTYGTPSTQGGTWVTITLDLSKLDKGDGFDKTRVKHLRFGYNYPNNIYLSNITFLPAAEQSNPTGFITQQYDVPSYGSATSGELEPAAGAVYTSSVNTNARASYVVDGNGNFALQHGETVNFHDQFRRGSYIYLEEVLSEKEQALYDTTWTMYENDVPVNSMVDDGVVDVAAPVYDMTDVENLYVADGRTEAVMEGTVDTSHEQKNAYDGNAPANSFVFRSYADPDSTSITTKLRVKFTNKVNTGSLTISKEKAGTQAVNGTFTFYVRFYNVGGLGLESAPIVAGPITLSVGGRETIDGIPLNTQYSIYEIKPADDTHITLDNVKRGNTEINYAATVYGESDAYRVDGTITGEETITYSNIFKPVVSLNLRKQWLDADGTALDDSEVPTSIRVQLQYRTVNTSGTVTKDWAPYGDFYDDITISPGYTSWNDYTYEFVDLDQNVYNENNVITGNYKYRVVELDSNGNVIEEGGILTDTYTVTYGSVESSTDGKVFNQTITNQVKPKLKVSVEKKWATLEGVGTPNEITVRLQKKVNGTWVKVADVDDQTLSSGNGWKYTFENLPDKDSNGAAIEYRVVELDSQNNVIGENSTVTIGNVDYRVTYSGEDGKATLVENTTNEYTQTITNTAVPEVTLQITKLDATDNSKNLDGVVFKLEKDGDSTFVKESTTDTDGIATFEGLKAGTYTLTETKAASGYSLLKSSITIVITESVAENGVITYTAKVDGVEATGIEFTLSGNTYTLAKTVYNKPQLVMPPTGGVGGFEFWILGGLLIMAVPLLMYTFIWYRKGGKYLQR